MIEILHHFLDLPAAFHYTSTRMLLAALTALMINWCLGPRFISWLYSMKIGQPIRKEECPLLGQLHKSKENTPTMGGLLILVSMLTSLVLWMDLTHAHTWLLGGTTIVLGVLGGFDDYLKLKGRSAKGLAGRGKLLVQCSVALFVGCYLLYPSFQEWFFWTPPAGVDKGAVLNSKEIVTRLYVPFVKKAVIYVAPPLVLLGVLFVVVGASNAVNLTDGLDGLAAGCTLMVACCLAAFAFLSNHQEVASYLNLLYINGSGEIAIYLSAMMGACLGFLWYNSHPAQVFMGDVGSLPIGGVLGVVAVLLKRELLFGLVGGVFVVEAVSVIIQVASYRLREGERVLLCAPLHHHFEYLGWPETKVVARFYIIGLLLALLGLATIRFQ